MSALVGVEFWKPRREAPIGVTFTLKLGWVKWNCLDGKDCSRQKEYACKDVELFPGLTFQELKVV